MGSAADLHSIVLTNQSPVDASPFLRNPLLMALPRLVPFSSYLPATDRIVPLCSEKPAEVSHHTLRWTLEAPQILFPSALRTAHCGRQSPFPTRTSPCFSCLQASLGARPSALRPPTPIYYQAPHLLFKTVNSNSSACNEVLYLCHHSFGIVVRSL